MCESPYKTDHSLLRWCGGDLLRKVSIFFRSEESISRHRALTASAPATAAENGSRPRCIGNNFAFGISPCEKISKCPISSKRS